MNIFRQLKDTEGTKTVTEKSVPSWGLQQGPHGRTTHNSTICREPALGLKWRDGTCSVPHQVASVSPARLQTSFVQSFYSSSWAFQTVKKYPLLWSSVQGPELQQPWGGWGLEEEATLPRSQGESHTARTQNRSVQLCSAFLSTLPLFCLAASTGKNVQFKFIKRKSLFIIY